ncbi:MAG: amino acid--[acyl-carrier-protein] ligase [Candidatus Promineifilaceae bacterium]
MDFQNHPQTPRYQANVVQLLQETHQIIDFGSGQVGFSGLFLEVIHFFEHVFLTLAQKMMAQEYTYPHLIHTKSLQKHDYLLHFPHLIAFALPVIQDQQTLQIFMATIQANPSANINAYLQHPPEWILRPAVCFHVYEQLDGCCLHPNAPLIFTTQGRCFRHEEKPVIPSRLRVFTMREVVFIGSADFVSHQRQKMISLTQNLVKALDLQAHLETATDPFFTDSKRMGLYQKLGKLKYEMHLNIPYEGGTIAATSFNIHNDFFTKAHNISSQTETPIATGCVAFGIERWAYAFLAQHGPDKQNWPVNLDNRDQLLQHIWEPGC